MSPCIHGMTFEDIVSINIYFNIYIYKLYIYYIGLASRFSQLAKAVSLKHVAESLQWAKLHP